MKILVFTGLLAFLLLGAQACTTRVEACMDPVARNYNAEADDDCCCTYYQLQWTVRHFARDTSELLQLNSPFTDPQGQILTPLRLDFLISEVELVDANGVAWPVQDSTYLFLRDGSAAYVQGGLGVLNPNGIIYKFGKFAHWGEYVALRFRIGLTAPASEVDGERVTPTTHVLSASASPTMYDSINNVYNHYNLVLDNVNADTSYVLRSSPTTIVEIPVELSVRDGADTNISLDIFYSRFFDGVQWGIDAPADIANKIMTNAPAAFTLRQ